MVGGGDLHSSVLGAFGGGADAGGERMEARNAHAGVHVRYRLSNGPLIDRPEIRVVRVDLEPGAVRLLHTHDDVRYHLMIPVTGSAQANLGPATSLALQQWQPVFFEGGTTHGFQNNGTTTVSIMEIFVRK
jgi:quercetin dioxygenase-like cupin family protein